MRKGTLSEKVASVLQIELGNCGSVIAGDGNIVVTINTEDFQERLGPVFIQSAQVTDQHFPYREQDIRLFFRDRYGRQQNVFKIWHSFAA